MPGPVVRRTLGSALAAALVLVLAGPGGTTEEPEPTPGPSATPDRSGGGTSADTDPCLDRRPLRVLEGPRSRFPNADDQLVPGLVVDARTAWWSVPVGARAEQRYPLSFEGSADGADVCFVGGLVRREQDHDTTRWSEWHDSGAAVTVKVPRITIVGTTIENVGDAVAFGTRSARDWTLRDVLVRGAHDDCVQNDAMNSGRIERSFFDGCYVFYSARGPVGTDLDGGDELVTITDSLVRMKAMPHVYKPDRYAAPGHGPVFKMSRSPSLGRSPRLAIHDSVFLLNQDATVGSLDVPSYDTDGDSATPSEPYLTECSGNTLVWTGDGSVPGDWPDCFEITTDEAVWEQAVEKWEHATGMARSG